MCSTTHKILKNKTRKDTRMKFYKTMTLPKLLSWENKILHKVT